MFNRQLVTTSAMAALAVLAAGTLAACGGTADASSGGGSDSAKSVTIYSADGLADWYKPEFAAFTQQTGIAVNYVEAGSSEVVSRIEKERANPQADVLVTLPPFIQQADKDGVLTSLDGVDVSTVASSDKASDDHWTSLVNNYSCFIVSTSQSPAPKKWDDLLSSTYKGKLQYSTPGQAGDGTAVLVLLEHIMGKDQALNYLKSLQTNNVGPSSSTGKLQPKVSTGSLLVANGDVQMNLTSIATDKSNFQVFFPASGTSAPQSVALPYAAGLTANAPHSANGQKLLNFLMSTDAQKQVSSLAYGIPVRSDVTPDDANSQKITQVMQGVDVYHPDWDAILSSLDSDVAAYHSAIGA